MTEMTTSTHIEEKIWEDRIDAMPCANCLICNAGGQVLYGGLRDRAFASPGLWNLRSCQDSACGTLWLDPMPTTADVWKAYRDYYTHADHLTNQLKQDFARRLFRQSIALLKASYLNRRYGYHKNQKKLQGFLLGWVAHVMPWRRSDWDYSVMFFPYLQDGKLLEVGCGSGSLLAEMAELGWQVEGLDVDPSAVTTAKMKGLHVKLGTLEESNYPDSYFDAICMSHVIEHVHDPVRLLRECHRVLKPGGRLSMVTPNAQSFLHRLFGHSWFALEPPRHLHIFTRSTLKTLLQRSGFQTADVFATIRDADGLFVASRSIRRSGKFKQNSEQPRSEKIYGRIAQVFEWVLAKVNPCAGEELTAVAKK
jgi:2-polyprenyl-3-methyl-5-hydroxy-6-metoxy-1,4-benzoquinol methylase